MPRRIPAPVRLVPVPGNSQSIVTAVTGRSAASSVLYVTVRRTANVSDQEEEEAEEEQPAGGQPLAFVGIFIGRASGEVVQQIFQEAFSYDVPPEDHRRGRLDRVDARWRRRW